MKKFWVLVCMIACIFGLTACGKEEPLTGYAKDKADYAQQYVVETIIPILIVHMNDQMASYYDEFTMEEVAYYIGSQYGMDVDGYAFFSAVKSFHSAEASVGAIQSIGNATVSLEGKEIIVEVELVGAKKNAVAEVILSNDLFMCLKSASLNPVSSTGELMAKAAMNTLIGMGTVFIVLVLISFIISGFSVIPKLQAAAAGKKAAEQPVAVQTEPQAEEPEGCDETDDLELVAVIAAAVTAAEGAVSPDGFVVRSIIRRA